MCVLACATWESLEIQRILVVVDYVRFGQVFVDGVAKLARET